LSEIAVNFQAHGVANVMAAFASIEKQAAKFGAAVLRGERSTTQAVIRETAKQHDAHVKARDKANQAEAKALLKSVTENKKAADKKIKEVDRAAKESVRLEERAAKQRERIYQQETRAFERESKRMGTIAQRARDQRMREEAAAAKASEQSRRNIGRSIGGSVTGAASNIFGKVGMVAGGILAVGGGFSAVDAVQTGIANRGRAADIAIASGGELNKQEVYSRAAQTATAYGTSTEKALAATDRLFAKSGNAKLSLDLMPKVLALATATGGDAGEIGEVAGQIYNTDKTLSASQVDAVTRGWAGQGRAGSVDMRELAQYGSRIAASASKFAGDKATNMVALGGLTQVSTAGGASSAAEATEAVAHLGADVYTNRKAFKRMGINAFDKNDRIVDPETLIKQSVIATKGNYGKLKDLFGMQSVKAAAGAGNIFQESYLKSKDGGGSEKDAMAAGTKAMNEAFKKYSDSALTEEQVRKDAADRLAETDKKVEAAMNDLRETVAEKLIPKLQELIPKLTELVPKFADLLTQVIAVAEWMGKNPFKTIVLAIAAAVAKDVAMAGIGKIIASAIANAAGGGGVKVPGGVGGGGAPGALGTAGAGLAIAAGALAVGSAGIAAIDASYAASNQAGAKAFASDMAAVNLGGEASAMKATTPEQLQKKKAALEAAQKAAGSAVSQKKKEQDDYNSFFSYQRDTAQLATLFGGGDAVKTKETADKASLERSKKEFDELTEKLKAVNAALDLMSKNASNADLGKPKAGQPLSSPDRSKG
jgi:hypothetical protein